MKFISQMFASYIVLVGSGNATENYPLNDELAYEATDASIAKNYRSEASSASQTLNSIAEMFVRAFNENDEEVWIDFISNYWIDGREEDVASRVIAIMGALQTEAGVMKNASVRVVDDQLMIVTAQRASTNEWQNFQFKVQDNKIRLVFIGEAIEPMTLPQAGVQDRKTATWLLEQVGKFPPQHQFSGVVSIWEGDVPLLEFAAGMADIEGGVKNNIDTRFGMASGSKMFTAIAIGQLIESGKLNLTDEFIEYYPQLAKFPGFSGVTVQHLLSHTSGIGDYWDDEFESHWEGINNHLDYLPDIIRNTPTDTFGEFSYSNSNFILLGLLIEAITGQDYYSYVQENIFAPAKMQSAGFLRNSQEGHQKTAMQYIRNENSSSITFKQVEIGNGASAAGGAVATAADLHKFASALHSGLLMDLDIVEQFTEQRGDELETYVLGFISKNKYEVNSHGHGGTGPGTNFFFEHYPELNISLFIASNYDTIAASEIYRALDQIIRTGE